MSKAGREEGSERSEGSCREKFDSFDRNFIGTQLQRNNIIS